MINPQEQYEIFKRLLEGRRGYDKSSPLFEAVTDWLKYPLGLKEDQQATIKLLICTAFHMTEDELSEAILKRLQLPMSAAIAATPQGILLEAKRREAELDNLLPPTGFIRDYCDYTLNSEAPLAYHVFCAIAGVVATVNRRVHFDMGSFRLYPPLGVLILGPSGIKKTSAADIMVGIVNEMALTPIYAEKLTPEALVDAMKGGNATGLVYSPEMTVLVSRQRYMETIIPLLTRFMDSPDTWRSETIMRGKGTLTDVAITCLMCSTLDWFIKNTPETVFGGGFIARNVMVLQETSTRTIALPKPGNDKLRQKLMVQLADMHSMMGEMAFSNGVSHMHEEWYVEDKQNHTQEYDILETYFQRKPSHLIRIAMVLHLATCRDLDICADCWQRAKGILEWTEQMLPSLASKLFKSSWGEDQDLIIRKIKAARGRIRHSDLIRKMQYKMGAATVRSIIGSLKEAGIVTEHRTMIEHYYTLTELAKDV